MKRLMDKLLHRPLALFRALQHMPNSVHHGYGCQGFKFSGGVRFRFQLRVRVNVGSFLVSNSIYNWPFKQLGACCLCSGICGD